MPRQHARAYGDMRLMAAFGVMSMLAAVPVGQRDYVKMRVATLAKCWRALPAVIVTYVSYARHMMRVRLSKMSAATSAMLIVHER